MGSRQGLIREPSLGMPLDMWLAWTSLPRLARSRSGRQRMQQWLGAEPTPASLKKRLLENTAAHIVIDSFQWVKFNWRRRRVQLGKGSPLLGQSQT